MVELIRLCRKAANEWRNNDAYYQAAVLIDSLCDRLEKYESRKSQDSAEAVREKSEWILNRNGSATCKKCLHTTLDAWGVDKWLNFCPNCGADMRAEEQNRARGGENDG